MKAMKTTKQRTPDSPIGVFDSGLGGLSVAAELKKQLPNENILFFGDSARNPYGTKDKATIRGYCFEIVDRFAKQGVKAVVIACNTATSAAANELRKAYDFDIVGMEPALKPAAERKTPSKIAVWATELTLKEEKFAHLEQRYDDDHEIIRVACPKLVELVETDALHREETVNAVLEEYLRQSKGAEFIVLGCTHFIFYKERLQHMAGEGVQVIDGNAGTIRHLKDLLAKKNLLATAPEGNLTIENSDPEKLDLSWKLMKRLEDN